MRNYEQPPEAYQCPACLSFRVARDKYSECNEWYCSACHQRGQPWEFGIGVKPSDYHRNFNEVY